MESETKGAKKYFDAVPRQWDALYSHENWFMHLINRWLRKGLFLRHRLTFENCGDLTGAKILDVGCGTGRYSIECAKRGASRVVGIDFAPSMIEFSQSTAQQMGVAQRCEFICDDFLAHQFDESFDIVLMLGLFDYIQEPEPIFTKVAALNPRRFLASFPKRSLIWSTQRHIRYCWIKKCPIYYYTEEQLERLYREAPFSSYRVIPCEKGFFGVAGAE